MKTQILEGNKLIAEFMGFIFYDDENKYYHIKDGYFLCEPSQLKYHSSWDWLMLVVEKIENVNPENNVYETDFSFQFTNRVTEYSCCVFMLHANEELFTVDAPTRIESAWLAVVEFIKWYNKNK